MLHPFQSYRPQTSNISQTGTGNINHACAEQITVPASEIRNSSGIYCTMTNLPGGLRNKKCQQRENILFWTIPIYWLMENQNATPEHLFMSFSYVPATPYVVMQFVVRFPLRCGDFFVTQYLVVQQETRKYDHISLPLSYC